MSKRSLNNNEDQLIKFVVMNSPVIIIYVIPPLTRHMCGIVLFLNSRNPVT